ncbi:hypothetical protein AMELA_G00088730 [Ameiurus melas]|uniref:Uncharacterized protein n=1 Tax=Ameiurus melas TaxID=219545 RepID=A0A7J6AZ23_AMEME|nr:hypothetical protein AMELA_G00088730 [Ameiurus melas]
MFCKSFNNMQRNIYMALIQIRNLHLGLCTIVFLLTCGDCTKSYERNILHQMNGTAFKGETVVFHCNGTLTSELKDIGWRKDGNLIFIYSPVINQTVFNYTSSRMQLQELLQYVSLSSVLCLFIGNIRRKKHLIRETQWMTINHMEEE